MKKFLLALTLLGTTLSFAQNSDWKEATHKAWVKTDLRLCFKAVAKQEVLASSCHDSILGALEIGMSKEEIVEELHESTKWHVIASNAAAETDEKLLEELQTLIDEL